MRISKYHGCGNNFIIVRESEFPEEIKMQGYSSLAQKVCDINTGIGADGLIIVREEPELEMVFFNCDGSQAPMCGNGIRCFAHFCMEEGIRRDSSYSVKTLAGDMVVEVTDRTSFKARINMGKPVFEPAAVGVDSDAPDFLDGQLTLDDGTRCQISSLFMGTVHTVVFVDSYDGMDVSAIGAQICNHPVFKEKTNVNFVKVVNDHTLEMKTYERGVGMTLACGTGACASVVVANLRGLCKRETEVILTLGKLTIEIKDDDNVYMEGPSAKIADGTLYWKGE